MFSSALLKDAMLPHGQSKAARPGTAAQDLKAESTKTKYITYLKKKLPWLFEGLFTHTEAQILLSLL